MAYEAIVERDERDQRNEEMRKAKKAMGELKRARLVEGPTDLAVMDISKKVDQITADRDRLKAENDDYFDATKILGTDEIKARI
jgi:hypothetical protein